MPNRTSHRVEQKVLAAGPALNPSTVGRILVRYQLPHLSAIDPITAQEVLSAQPNRYEHTPRR